MLTRVEVSFDGQNSPYFTTNIEDDGNAFMQLPHGPSKPDDNVFVVSSSVESRDSSIYLLTEGFSLQKMGPAEHNQLKAKLVPDNLLATLHQNNNRFEYQKQIYCGSFVNFFVELKL